MVGDECRSKGRFEELKGVLTLRRPDNGASVCVSRVSGTVIPLRGDKPSVEGRETQERLDVLSISWSSTSRG